MSLCYKCLRHLMSHKWAGPFLQPVDPIALDLPDYFDIVKNPMDFGTLQRRIETQMVTSKEEFAALARQIFANALLYNKPDSDVCVSLRTVSRSGVMARVLSEEFEKEFLQITGRIFAAGPEPSRAIPAVSRRSQTFEEPAAKEPRVAKPAGNQRAKRLAEMAAMEAQIQNLQGKITQMEREIQAKKKGGKTEVDTRPMTVEEKKALSVQIGQLNEAEVAGLLAIVKESIPEEQNHQEAIELDFNMLPNEILRQMERYIKECKEARNSSRKHRKTYTHTKESLFDYDDNHFVDDFDNTGRNGEAPTSRFRTRRVLTFCVYHSLFALCLLRRPMDTRANLQPTEDAWCQLLSVWNPLLIRRKHLIHKTMGLSLDDNNVQLREIAASFRNRFPNIVGHADLVVNGCRKQTRMY